jgi:hypothetical protein
MSYEDGWAALNLQMPKRIPRTEYSVQMHWDLIKEVTGIDVNVDSPDEVKRLGAKALAKCWNFDFYWSTLISDDEFGAARTDMGHAEYAAGGVDRRDTIFCPYEDPEDVLNFQPYEVLGKKNQAELVRRFEAHYQANAAENPDGVNMTGVYVTCISGLIGLFGWDMLLLAAGTDPVRFGEMTNRYAGWIQQYFDALAESNVPVVMMHDDFVWANGGIFRPSWYREYVFPNYKKYVSPMVEAGKKVMFCSDGNFTRYVDDVVGAGVHGFVFEPLTSLEYIVEKYGQSHVIIGNADTRILLSGTKDEIRAEVARCMTLGRGCPGFFMAVGNHIPPNTPIENALCYNEAYEALSIRK